MPALVVSDLCVQGSQGRTILAVARLEVPAGQALGIRGPSGAGKSTLLHTIAGLIKPQRGAVLWDGQDLARQPEHRRDAFRLATMGLIFQDFLLFEELSPLDNASISAAYVPPGRRKALRRRARDLLDALGVPPERRSVAGFSGGERQRVAVARALAPDPAVILADEPTASLDRSNADRLVADLIALARDKGRTIIAVSHDPAVTGAMDRVIEVVDGTVRS